MEELNNELSTNENSAPKIEKVASEDINKNKADDIVDKIMDKILKIK